MVICACLTATSLFAHRRCCLVFLFFSEFSRVDGYVVNEFDRKKDGAKHAECNANMIQKEWKAVQKLGQLAMRAIER